MRVTGSGGFIGSYVVPLLKERSHEVVEHDSADVYLHLAWRGYAGSGAADENLLSLEYGLQVLRQMRDCRRFIGVGSCFEYAPYFARPMTEEDFAYPSGQNPFYGMSKIALEYAARLFCELSVMSFAWARIFNVYGPDDPHPTLTAALLRGLHGEHIELSPGMQIRDYLHVQDVASALVALVESDVQGPVNICSGEGVTIRNIAARLAAIHGGSIETLDFGALPYRENDPMYLVGDNTKLRSLGWTPTHTWR